MNRGYPGLGLAFVGILLNATVIVINGGYMPVWEPSLNAAGLTATVSTSRSLRGSRTIATCGEVELSPAPLEGHAGERPRGIEPDTL